MTSVVVWITEGTWQASVDAARQLAPADARLTLLHVTAVELPDTARGAYLGLFGRGQQPGRDPGERIAEYAAVSAGELLEAAAQRLGRPCARIVLAGRVEREVVTVAADADLLIVAREGDRSRLGPKSVGKAARFILDHAPCMVLLVWPEMAPGISTIPPVPPPPPGPPLPVR